MRQGRGRHRRALLAARECRRGAAGELRVELHETQQLADTLLDPLASPAREAQGYGHVFGDAHVGEEADSLEDVADRAAQQVRLERGRVATVEENPPGVRLHEAVDHLQRRRLARPGGSDEAEDLAAFDAKRHAVHGEGAAVASREMLDLDHPPSTAGTRSHWDAAARLPRPLIRHRLAPPR